MMSLPIEEARRLAGGSGRVFGEHAVFLYDHTWNPSDVFLVWVYELRKNDAPMSRLLFWWNPGRDRYEALFDYGTLGGWPYFLCAAWCYAP